MKPATRLKSAEDWRGAMHTVSTCVCELSSLSERAVLDAMVLESKGGHARGDATHPEAMPVSDASDTSTMMHNDAHCQ